MKIAIIIEVLIAVAFTAIMVSQVLWPLLCGTPWFPILRKKERRLRHEIAEAKQAQVEEELQEELKRLSQKKETHA